MKDFFELVSLEIRLTLRNKLFWLLAVLSVISVQLTILTVLLIQLILIHLFTRDERTNFSVVLQSLPHANARLYLARAFAALAVLLLLWPFMLANLAFFPQREIAHWLLIPQYVLFLTLKYTIVCLTQIGVILLFSMLTRQLPWLYLLSILFVIKSLEIASNTGLLPSSAKLFVFGQGFMLPSAPSAAIGFFPEQDIYPGFALFHIGLTVLLTAIAIAVQMLRRSEPVLRSKLILGLFLLSLITLYSGSHIVFQELNHRNHGYEELIKAAAKEIPRHETRVNFVPESYNLAVKLKTAAHYFDGTAIIKGKLTEPSDKIFFTLRDCFTVDDIISAATGESLSWSQRGSALTVYLPNTFQEYSSLSLSISYSGEVWEWFPDCMAQPSGPVNFIAAPYSLLRSGYAWYPTPGLHDLYTYSEYANPITDAKIPALNANRIVHPALPFTMTVDIDTEAMVASNLEQTAAEALSGEYSQRYHFYSDSGHNIFLLSGPYEHQIVSMPNEKISVYYFPVHKGERRRIINSLSEPYEIYKDMLQEKATPTKAQVKNTLVEIPAFLLFSEDRQPVKDLTLTDSILLSENYFKSGGYFVDWLNDIQENKRDIAILQHWWQEDFSAAFASNNNIKNSLSYYLFAVGLEKTRMPGAYQEARQNVTTGKRNLIENFTMPFLTLSPLTREVFLVLDTIRSELGEESLKKVTRLIYHQYEYLGTIRADDFSAAVNTVLAASSLPAEKHEEIQNRLANIEKLTTTPAINNVEIAFTAFAFYMEECLP